MYNSKFKTTGDFRDITRLRGITIKIKKRNSDISYIRFVTVDAELYMAHKKIHTNLIKKRFSFFTIKWNKILLFSPLKMPVSAFSDSNLIDETQMLQLHDSMLTHLFFLCDVNEDFLAVPFCTKL